VAEDGGKQLISNLRSATGCNYANAGRSPRHLIGAYTHWNCAPLPRTFCGGQAYRLKADLLKDEFERYGPTMRLLLRHTQALITQITQTAVCNRHHSGEAAARDTGAAQQRRGAIAAATPGEASAVRVQLSRKAHHAGEHEGVVRGAGEGLY
jgi:hypothetical protein